MVSATGTSVLLEVLNDVTQRGLPLSTGSDAVKNRFECPPNSSNAHGGHVTPLLTPPQSMSVSVPFLTLSVQVGVLQKPAAQ